MSNLTISQALRQIAKLKGRLKESQERAMKSVIWEQSKPPAYEFGACTGDIAAVRKELIDLEGRLRHTNAVTIIGEGNLATAIIVLQEYKAEIAWLRGLTVAAQATTSQDIRDYQGNVTTKVVHCALPEAAKNKRIEELQDKFDRLNDAVETLNHKTALV